MPDKKRKFETKVHRKTLNPFFNETFAFKNVSTYYLDLEIEDYYYLDIGTVGPRITLLTVPEKSAVM